MTYLISNYSAPANRNLVDIVFYRSSRSSPHILSDVFGDFSSDPRTPHARPWDSRIEDVFENSGDFRLLDFSMPRATEREPANCWAGSEDRSEGLSFGNETDLYVKSVSERLERAEETTRGSTREGTKGELGVGVSLESLGRQSGKYIVY